MRKEKLSKAKIGTKGNATGCKHSEETKNKKPVIQLDLNGNFLKEWSSTQEIAHELGFLGGQISSVCNGKRKSHAGFKWRFKNG